MGKLNIYLSGATKNINENFQSWRTKCTSASQNGYYTNLNFIDPISYFNYTDKKPKPDRQCLDTFMWMINKSDMLLVNLDHSDNSIGTGMEVEHAYCHNIPIIGFGKKEYTHYNWIKERCSVSFDTLDEAIDYIYNTYTKVVN